MMRKYYVCNIYKKRENDSTLIFLTSVRFERDEKRAAIKMKKFVKNLGYYALVWPRVEEI